MVILDPDIQCIVNELLGRPARWRGLARQGTTNHIYVSEGLSDTCVLRVNTSASVLGVNRGREEQVLAAIQGYAWAPVVIAITKEWLLSPLYDEASTHDPMSIVAIVAELQRLPEPEDSSSLIIDYHGLWRSYQEKIEQAPLSQQKRWLPLLHKTQALFNQLPPLDYVWTHHDLHPGNIVASHQTANLQAVLLDWEYAGIGSAWVDACGLHQHWGISAGILCKELPAFRGLSASMVKEGVDATQHWLVALEAMWQAVNGLDKADTISISRY